VPSIRLIESADIAEHDREFFDSIRDAAEVLPFSLKDKFESHPVVKGALKRVVWTTAVDEFRADELWVAARKIEDNARLCHAEDRPEESWSDQVVLKILELALESSGLAERVSLLTL